MNAKDFQIAHMQMEDDLDYLKRKLAYYERIHTIDDELIMVQRQTIENYRQLLQETIERYQSMLKVS